MPTPRLGRFKFIFFLILSGCATQPAPTTTFQDWFPDKQVYLQKDCRFLSPSLDLLKALPGTYCLQRKNSTVIANLNRLYEMDNDLKILWELKPILAHHQLNGSEIDDTLLTMDSEYHQGDDGLYRYDRLVVISGSGRIIKTFSFQKYFKKIKFVPDSWGNGWTTDGYQNKSFEKTHFNSFRELFKTVDGQRVLTGYLAYSTQQNKAYLLDEKLKNVVRVLGFGHRSAHDVRQYSETELIFFLNIDTEDAEPRQSKIATYDLVSNEIKVLYQSDKVKNVYPYCGSVQPLPQRRLFISYSTCMANMKEPSSGSYVEMVDLTTKKSTVIRAPDWLIGNGTEIVDRIPSIL